MSGPNDELLAKLNCAVRTLHQCPSRGPIELAIVKRIQRNVQRATERPSHPLARMALEDALTLTQQLLNTRERPSPAVHSESEGGVQ